MSNRMARPVFLHQCGGLAHQTSLRSRSIMMFYANSPPFGDAGGLFSSPGYCNAGPLLKSCIPAWAFPLLPQSSTAAELFVVNLIAHHDPQPDPQFAGRCDPGFAHSFVDELAPIEAFQLRIFPRSEER